MQGTQTASLDTCKSTCVCNFDCCSIQQFHFTTPLANLTRSPDMRNFHHCVACCALGESFQFFLLTEAPVPGVNNQRQTIVYIKSITHMYPHHPVFDPPQHVSLELADIDQDQQILLMNGSCSDDILWSHKTSHFT